MNSELLITREGMQQHMAQSEDEGMTRHMVDAIAINSSTWIWLRQINQRPLASALHASDRF